MAVMQPRENVYISTQIENTTEFVCVCVCVQGLLANSLLSTVCLLV